MQELQKYDPASLFRLGYGLYVITCRDGDKDNGMIGNTVMQVANDPCRLAVCINKQNYSHDIILKTGVMNINCLSEKAPFAVFERFGFVSGRNTDKFAGVEFWRSQNGLPVLIEHVNAFLSLQVVNYTDLGTHGMFICTLENGRVINNDPSMTYAYYHANVKPKPGAPKKKGYVCKICGYVYEGEELPADFVCPICKHGAEDFEPLK